MHIIEFFCIQGNYHEEMPEEEIDLGILPEWIMNPVLQHDESVKKNICGASKEVLPMKIGNSLEELKPGREYDCSAYLCGCNTFVFKALL